MFYHLEIDEYEGFYLKDRSLDRMIPHEEFMFFHTVESEIYIDRE